MKKGYAVIIVLALTASTYGQWLKQTVNTTASFRGLSVVNEKIVWASGTEGTVIRTIDGGKTWKVMTVPGAEKLDFRDIEAFDANTAYILSIGNGESSRIYKTIDGGRIWKEQFRNKNEKAFFDAMTCWSREICFAMSDPVDGKFIFIHTVNGGNEWYLDDKLSAQATEGEAAFAASGTCLIGNGARDFSFATGGTSARVFKSYWCVDAGCPRMMWIGMSTPITAGSPASGIFSMAKLGLNGVIVGGNYEKPDEAKDNLGFTTDGGRTWKSAAGLTGYRSGVTYADKRTIIAVGTNGSDISRDGGATWLRIDGANYNSVQAKNNNAIWAVGPKGCVTKLNWSAFLAANGYKVCPKNMICEPINIYDLQLSNTEVTSDQKQIDIATKAVGNFPPNWYDYAISGGWIVGFGSNVK